MLDLAHLRLSLVYLQFRGVVTLGLKDLPACRLDAAQDVVSRVEAHRLVKLEDGQWIHASFLLFGVDLALEVDVLAQEAKVRLV